MDYLYLINCIKSKCSPLISETTVVKELMTKITQEVCKQYSGMLLSDTEAENFVNDFIYEQN